MGTVVIVGTMDTKWPEFQFVRACIINSGNNVIVMDVGVMKESPPEVDIKSDQVAESGGCTLAEIRFSREGSDTRARALEVMGNGAAVWLKRLLAEKRCDAVFGMGGSGGTSMLGKTFRTLPLGLPKLIVTTMLAGDVKDVVGTKDITMMYSVTDIAGLNRVSRTILRNAANAIAGMAKCRTDVKKVDESNGKPLIALTMFGVTTKGVQRVRQRLELEGFETIIFHTTGGGGRAMEEMIEQGLIDGVVDYTLAELNGHLITKMNDAGAGRLTAASRKGIPQVVVPGALDVCNFPGVENLPAQFHTKERHLIVHNSMICAVKASPEELQKLGETVGEKLTLAAGNTILVYPLQGIDSYCVKGGPWYQPEDNRILLKAIKSKIGSVPVDEVDADINDEEFANIVSERFIELWRLS